MEGPAPWLLAKRMSHLALTGNLGSRSRQRSFGDSRAQGGTGLGLSLVKHILNRHRGRFLIESVPKNGAVFTACFPQAKAPSTH
jgi:signal transduction histidine kinase